LLTNILRGTVSEIIRSHIIDLSINR